MQRRKKFRGTILTCENFVYLFPLRGGLMEPSGFSGEPHSSSYRVNGGCAGDLVQNSFGPLPWDLMGRQSCRHCAQGMSEGPNQPQPPAPGSSRTF